MNQVHSMKLLVLSAHHSKANQLLAQLRNEGITPQAMALSTEEELAEQLQSSQWDAILCFEFDSCPVERALLLLQQTHSSLPLIFIKPNDSLTEALSVLKLGASAVINEDDMATIIFSLKRAVLHFRQEKENLKLAINLKQLEQRHQLLLDKAQQALAYISEGMPIYCNQSYADFFNQTINVLNTTPLLDLVSSEDAPRLKALLSQESIQTRNVTHKINLQAALANGEFAPIEMHFTPITFQSQDCLQLCIQASSGNVQFSAEKEQLETQDLLTRLANKAHFMNEIEKAISQAIHQDVVSSIIIIEVNEFVDIKSTIGKANTNAMLNDISQFLQNSINKSYTAARLDDYIFGLLLDDSNAQDAIELASFIKGKINNHITSTALPSLQLSCSIGIAAINGHALDAEVIISRAQVNLNATTQTHHAKSEFKISDSLDHKVNDMINYLSIALDNNYFKLLFQPLVNLKGNGADGYEVLTRMLDSEGNTIPPNEFIPLAILNGMGEKIDKVVITSAFEKIKTAGPSPHNLIVTITNNSLVSPTFLPWLSEQLQLLRLPADLLVLQISEIDICNSLEHATKFCQGLSELGVQKAVCHFGCAIKPLEYLDDIKPDYVKLDRSIIRDIAYSSHQKNSVQELANDLHEKNCLVIAPQVEDMDMLPLLWGIGIDFVQGYCLQRPSQEMNYEFIQNEEITLDVPQQGTSH